MVQQLEDKIRSPGHPVKPLMFGTRAVKFESVVDIHVGSRRLSLVRDLTLRSFSTSSLRQSLFSSVTWPSAMSLTPPQPPPSWDHTDEDITRLTKELIEKDRAVQDKIGALDPKDCNFESVFRQRQN
ncbi:hypothetical protein BDQ12DRAFT_664326 [Crucibulum laeve]|uniref:Uncharacterized protein n=1 Tax=Crucibulum laeve TaxID=68775 RepID=A0A5C3M7E5_9AGAR|nr:hypothetical protein BDQ12DRAFT_664326 [Crucibulum laeve]